MNMSPNDNPEQRSEIDLRPWWERENSKHGKWAERVAAHHDDLLQDESGADEPRRVETCEYEYRLVIENLPDGETDINALQPNEVSRVAAYWAEPRRLARGRVERRPKPDSWESFLLSQPAHPEHSTEVEQPTRQDFGVAIELLKRHGMAGIEAAAFHGNGPTADKALEATEAVTRMVAWLRVQREETCS